MNASRKKWLWLFVVAALLPLGIILTGVGRAAAPSGTLTLTLDASLDGGGDIKANAIARAELLSAAGAVVKTATVKAGAAQFNLSGLKAGDYFIRVNGLADDLVPTRIDDPTKSITQVVGKKLRASVIGTVADPIYRIKTFSKGQKEHPIVKYSTGKTAAPERYAYAVVSYKTSPPKLEIRTLGTAAPLVTRSPSSPLHPSAGTPAFTSWILGGKNHGKEDNYGGNDKKCNTCHGNLDTHVPQHAKITTNGGFCFQCHYGKGGDPQGMIDPRQ